MKELIKDKLLNPKTDNPNITYYVLVSIFCVFLFYLGVFTRFTTDYHVHTVGMAKLSISPLLNPLNWPEFFSTRGYPLWFICGKTIMRIISCPAWYAAGMCTGLFLVVSYWGVLLFLKYRINDNKYDCLIALLAFVLFVLGPVWLPWKTKFIIVGGNGGPNVWHNATNICGRAIGIYAFYYSMKLLDIIIDSNYKENPKLKQWITLTLLYYLSLLAKPSFAQIFVPAFGFLLIFYLIKSKGKFFKSFLWFLATAILPLTRLIYMSFFYFGEEGITTQSTGKELEIIIPTITVIIKALKQQVLLIMFPIIIFCIMVFLKKITRYHLVVFLMWFFSLVYVLAFMGSAKGEMGWCYYIAAFFVFLIAIQDFIKLFFVEKRIIKYKIGSLVFILTTIVLTEHFAVGLYYLLQLIVMGKTKF